MGECQPQCTYAPCKPMRSNDLPCKRTGSEHQTSGYQDNEQEHRQQRASVARETLRPVLRDVCEGERYEYASNGAAEHVHPQQKRNGHQGEEATIGAIESHASSSSKPRSRRSTSG